MQPHDVIDPQGGGVPEEVRDDRPRVGVAVLADALRMRWWKPPVLPAREELVGRRPGRGLQGERGAMPPDVVARPIGAERQIETQPATLGRRLLDDAGELSLGEPLREEVVAAEGIGFGCAAESSVARAGRPGPPPRPASVDLGAEPGVIAQLRRLRHEALVRPWARTPKEALGQRLERRPLGSRHRPVVHEAATAPCPRSAGKPSIGIRASRPVDVDEDLVPEQAARRRVRTRLERLVEERRQQR
jgi:hypothetical protein